ncbi:hypothetical protein [Haliangium ochraceum]|uniref:Putative DNA binding protein n=1 Tax=Haliangium ochraceum (strain DSM 14365 / JCM 11303 / SMP-2) TaxID=502025 RepID=D0LQ63_HALO1|nr:hypothetical protein [Haliangium ochraceum]ACY17100.1 putative DNA binding protein [Haliangium ochraceum DSM 14365]
MFDTIQDQVNAHIEAFISDITELAKEAARETLNQALGSGADGALLPRSEFGDLRRRKGGKRSPEEIEKTAETLLEYISENPGQRMETIGRAMNASTQELTLPIKKLLSSGKLRTEGQKRATTYFKAEEPSESKSPAVRRRRRSSK